MNKIKTGMLMLAMAGMAFITQLKAQATADDTATVNTAQTHAVGDYTWIIAVAVVVVGLVVAIIYRSRRNKKEDGRPMEDESINNPASGI